MPANQINYMKGVVESWGEDGYLKAPSLWTYPPDPMVNQELSGKFNPDDHGLMNTFFWSPTQKYVVG